MKFKKTKKVFIMLLGVMLLCAGCGKSKTDISGTYKGEVRLGNEYLLTLSDDGTCTMVRTVYSSWLENGSESESHSGIWRENDSDDTYEIILNGWSCTLYAEPLESGDLLVTSDASWWDNTTFSKE